ncbi:S8 family peptidase [Algoriphagus vanfongensis]|uniref:S8 family peptidase n=1 Tax=Algoriphagus vanfongensis TaxID=426371 RepID=UPI0004198B7C|nr:S8 family peptidase [Algoriphagus vanfongensis]
MLKLWNPRALLSLAAVGAMTFACQPQEENPIPSTESVEFIGYAHGEIIPGKYIVRLNPSQINFRKTQDYAANTASMRKISEDLLSKYRIDAGNIEHVYGSSIEGFSATLSQDQYQSLLGDPSVQYIEQDRVVMLAPPPGKGKGGNNGGSNPQEIPWGITRVGGGSYSGSNKAYIIDSGIDSSHPDLNVSANLGYNAFTKGRDSDITSDGNGHGTHVAGTVGAIDNEIGVIGVAPGVTLVPIKVLDSRGSGSYSGVIAGVNFVADNASPGDVANMSLGGPTSASLDAAVVALAQSGVKVALAAGNESQNANNSSPARVEYSGVYTVSAIDSDDNFAYFSNYGNPPIEYAAPGVNILSTVPGGYASYNGTSMASPHVAGLLLLGTIHSDGQVNSGDPDGQPDVIAHH